MEKEGARKGIRKKLDNAGMSLVELLCGVAILALISATIGGIMIVSAKTYQSGTTETTLQQEAQFTANRINGLIHDATDEVNYYFYNSADTLVKANPVDGNSEQVAINNGGTGKDRIVEIVNADKTYQVTYLAAAKQLTYTEVFSGVAGETQLLAENIETFSADASTFQQSRSITLDIGIEMSGKHYDMKYAVTSRNGETEADVSGVHRSAAIIIDPAEVYLEPKQYYDKLKVNVSGSTLGFTQSLEGNTDTVETKVELHSTQTDTLCITMGKNEKGNTLGHFYVKIATNETNDDGAPLATRLAQVNVRRVNDMGVTKTLLSGTEYAQNAVYDIDAKVIGTYLEKALGTSYDADYISPYDVDFQYSYKKLDGTTLSFDTYFEKVIHKEQKDEAGYPKLQLKLKQDMVDGSKLTITVTAKHPEGQMDGVKYNKSGIKYATVQQVVVIEKPDETDEIMLNTTQLCLEPQQLYQNLKVEMNGGVVDYDVVVSENTDTTTSAVKSGTDEIHVTPGKDEKGNASAQFLIDVSGKDSTGTVVATSQASVNVRRVNDMKVTSTQAGADHAIGTVYTITPTVIGTNLAQVSGASYDTDYINPRYVQFDYSYTIGGVAASFDSYFTADEVEDSDTPQVKLTLKQAMASGSKLVVTMTAKHPNGTNKSGLSYATVQKEFILEKTAETPTEPVGGWSDILRAQDYSFKDANGNGIHATEAYKSIYPQVDNNGVVNADTSQNTNPFFNKHSSQQRWFYRMREITSSGYEAWSEYRICQENGSAKKLNANETYRMEPDKAYQIEFINVVYDSLSKTLYYPIADELLNCNNGFQGYTAGWTGLGLTATQNYASQYNVGAVELTMDMTLTVSGTTTQSMNDVMNIGTKDSPIEMTSGYELVANLTTTFMHLGNEQAKFTLVAEKWNESTNAWEASSISSQSESTFFKINNVQNSSTGLYRLKMEIKDWSVRNISTSLLDTNNPVKFMQTYPLYHEATGDMTEKGFVYIKVVAAS